MTFQQIQRLDYGRLTYDQFLYTCAKNNRIPVRLLVFDNSKDKRTIIVLSKTLNDSITTRHMTFTKDSADEVLDMFERDFKDIQIEELDEAI